MGYLFLIELYTMISIWLYSKERKRIIVGLESVDYRITYADGTHFHHTHTLIWVKLSYLFII